MIAYNLFRAENPEFVKRSLRLVFNMYDNNLDSILLIFWFFAVIISTLTFFTSWNDMCYGFSVIRCMSHMIGYILCLIMFLSCVIRVDTKSEDNSQQNDEEETPLLNDDVDAELIDDEINVRCIKADKKETEVDVIDVDVELIDDDEIDVKCIEADKKETEVDEVDAKLIKIDNSEGQHEHLINASRFTINPSFYLQSSTSRDISIYIFTRRRIDAKSTLSNITNLMDNNRTAQFAIVNSMSDDDDDDQKMQLFKDYKLILC
ncbi:hypothetical protein RhiirA5_505356 [Rhizophagus irregularis]|uniref:Uncharacterized protein n=1 Tax=Rhizophagus irregularis TaxID=588596 RepID=A0A2N0NZY0_9GLOM|nr:hypothetical protein RhiirA5_505356 [Rhizophagus irregularis]PKC65377.1 hypothetical protein RhiirA1_536378 [Rhizophagus irregularis]